MNPLNHAKVEASRWAIFQVFVSGALLERMDEPPVWSWEPAWVPEFLGVFALVYLTKALITRARTY